METIVLENLTFTTLTDEILAVEALRQPEAFAELYRRHFIQIYRYHMGRTGGIQEAEDLTTITFVAALEGIRKYKGTGSFQAWLFGIARHQQSMHYRSRKREVTLEMADGIQDSSTPLELLASQRLQINQIHRCLELLKEERRETILLCIFADLSAEETAEILGKTSAAVKMLLLRGLRDIRNILSKNEKD
jgi:RNA polymerase sigma-70 factor (ECF subfamily)